MSDGKFSVEALSDSPGMWVVRNDFSWTIIVICERTGLVSAHGDFGTYANVWNPEHIGSKSVLEFVSGINFGYAMGKFIGARCVVDAERTMQAVKQSIINRRLRGEYDQERARELWDEVVLLDMDDGLPWNLRDTEWASDTDGWYEHICYDYAQQAYGFWETIWTPFVAWLRAHRMGVA